MKKIKFSHEYDKMTINELSAVPKESVLLEVFTIDSSDLSDDFKQYDTTLIVLLFKTHQDHHMLWTTIRRYTPQKFDYYKGYRGEDFEVVIEK